MLLCYVGYDIDRHPHTWPDLFKVLLFILMAFIIGLRVNVGVDYNIYVHVFEHPNGYRLQTMEPIWREIILFIREYSRNPQIFLLLCAAYTMFAFYKGIKKLSPTFYLSVFFFILFGFYYETANTVRQCAAMATILWGYGYLNNKKWIPFILLCVLAFMLHYSALFGIFILLFSKIKINRWILAMCLVGSIIGGPFIMDYLYGNFMPIMKAINMYQYETDQFDAGVTTGILQITYVALGLFVIFANSPKGRWKDSTTSSLVNLVIFSLCVYNIFYFFQPARRLYYYGFIFIIILLPKMLLNMKPKSRYLTLALITIVFLALLGRSCWEIEYNFNLL